MQQQHARIFAPQKQRMDTPAHRSLSSAEAIVSKAEPAVSSVPKDLPPALDQDALDELRMLGPEAFSEIIALYLVDAPTRLAELTDAAQRSDLVALHMAAHTLKSTSHAVGASAVAAAAAELAQLARSEGAAGPELGTRAARVAELFQAVTTELAVLARQPQPMAGP
jgi:HPt (histidine-containing phosphotransfer) domain-containing protein